MDLRRVGVIGLSSFTLFATGCDRLTATMQAASVVTETPDIADAQFMDPDLVSHLPIDQAAQSVTGVLVGLAERASPTSTQITPVAGAQSTVAWQNQQVSLCEVADANGAYQANSLPDTTNCGDTDLAYVVGEIYTTDIETATDVYQVKVKAPPPIVGTLVTFAPALSTEQSFGGTISLRTHAKGSALTVDWSADTANTDRNVFVTLVRINYTGGDASQHPSDFVDSANWRFDNNNPVFDNTPRQPAEIIKLITETPETSATIPATAFSQEGLYLLVVTATELNTDASSNLAIGSGALAGKGTAFVFYVK